MKLARVIGVVLALASPAAVATSEADASYDVSACGAAQAGANNSWGSFDTNPSYLETGNTCSSGGYLFADDSLTAPGNTPQGSEAGWKFSAPAGTTVTGASVNRDFFKHDPDYLLFVREADGTRLDSGCTFTVGSCEVSGAESWSSLSTSSISVGIHCSNNSGTVCGNGVTLHDGFAHLLSATITLTESTSPSVTSTGGQLLSGGWHSGSQNGTISATDNTGIQYVRVYVDNALVGTGSQTCDFTFAIPCPQASNVDVSVNAASVADGSHALQLAAVDPSGNESRTATTTVYVDNTPPAAPTGLHVVSQSGGMGPITLGWTNPAPDNGAPLSKVHWLACKSGGGCSAVQTQTGNLTSLSFDPSAMAPFSGSPVGSYSITVWLEDGAGNTSPANSASKSVDWGLSAPASPGPIPSPGVTGSTPTNPSPPRTVDVSVTRKPVVVHRQRCSSRHHRRSRAKRAANSRIRHHPIRCAATRHRSHRRR